ncbi:MAG: hypothetical protein HXY25_12135 [Alphaproteobacteria bacterium]|nr:hypothetical protein [Alphaproteobacteria bacterium]
MPAPKPTPAASRTAIGHVLILVLILAAPSALAEDTWLYKAETGPHAVAVADDLGLADAARNKTIPYRVTYPSDAEGTLAVILFSHGAYGSKSNYVPLAGHWASHGYVVIQPTHEDSVSLGNRLGDPSVFTAEISQSRPRDISALIDALGDIGVPGLEGRLDPDRIGMSGHSYGAGTTMMIAGMTLYSADGTERLNLGDPRVKAAAVLSGQGLGEGRTKISWQSVTMPQLVLTGTRDHSGRTGAPFTWRTEPFFYGPDERNYLFIVEGADHGFGGIASASESLEGRRPPNPEHVRYVESVTTAFFDAWLNGSQDAWAFFDEARVNGGSEGAVTLDVR